MTNKEFQNILALYPDEYEICYDNVFGWEKTHNMEDPYLYVNTDIGQIEIEPQEYRELDDEKFFEIVQGVLDACNLPKEKEAEVFAHIWEHKNLYKGVD